MKMIPARRMYAVLGFAAAMIAGAAVPASAQFQPRMGAAVAATAEKYHIEGSASYWSPNADIVVASAGFNIPGSQINFKNDLGLTDHRFPALKLTLRPARKHKFNFEYIPLSYSQTGTLRRDVIFNGQRYSVGLPLNSSLDWKAYHFSYEYDFLYKPRWYVGFVMGIKETDVTATLAAPIRSLDEFDRARAPIPALGGVGRVYVMKNLGVTVNVNGISAPKSLADRIQEGASAHYWDVDVNGTYSITRNVGAQVGYRSLDLGYVFKTDSGAFKFKGMYFGVVARY
jgi:hypothetical protein